MEQIMEDISNNVKKKDNEIKKKWYKAGKYILQGNKVKKHNEWKLSAKRTYKYYKIKKGEWEGPSPRELGKMRKQKFERLLKRREENNEGNLLETPNETMQNHVITTPQIQEWLDTWELDGEPI